MRAVVKVKQSQGRGPSNAARYIAESKLDPEREGKGQRPLFTNRGDNDLKYGDANRYLNGGRGRPAKGDLIHFSVSFRNEDFERLGATDEERKERLREAARWAMDGLKSDLRIAYWRWVAGIHLNTKHPHIHFLNYKETTDDKGKRRRLGKIPKRLLSRRDHSSIGGTRPVEGVIGRYFVDALDRELERAHEAGRERQEASTKMTNGRLEAGSEINKESAPPSSIPNSRDSSVGQVQAIRVVNRKHFNGNGGDNEVYIGRAMAGIKGSVLGNPFRIGRDGAREEVIEKYGRRLSWEIAERGDAYRELQRLAEVARAGELVLVCGCAPEKCHGEVIKSEIESINDLRNREPEAPDMSEILSHSLEFDTPLVHQGIEYRTVENFYQAMKTAKDDLETRRKIAAAMPDEARRLGAQIQARPDWPEICRDVMETALAHKFAPGTRWHARLRSTGDREITDGSRDNILGQMLMDIREEGKRRSVTFLDRLSGETRSWITLEVMPAIDRLLEAGKTRQEVFTEIDRQVYRRRLPADEKERSKEMAERARINDFLKARADLRLYSDDRLLELAERNPSPAGRELTRELILRGPRQRFGGEPDVRSDLREAFRDRHLSETGYETQHGKAGWLGRRSHELRDMHERGAVIKDDILVIPAEPHELNGVVNDRKPFMNELRYAFELIRDPARAVEFHTLGKVIAGRTANAKAEIEFFKYYYGLISREKGDEQGRLLGKGEIKAREEALEIILGKMRELAPAMEEQESRLSVEVQRPGLVDSLEEIREAQAGALYDDEQEHMPEPADVQAIGESDTDLDEPEATEREPEAGHFIFNTAARTVNLNDESLRLPGGLTFEDRNELVGVHMPNIDAKLESGMSPKTILSGIDELVEERNRNLPEDLTARQRERALTKNQSAGAFLKDYVAERLKDPETRALNRSEVFREAHTRIIEARTSDELNRASDAARNDNRFNERDRKLLFFGRAPDHHTQEMRDLRRTWWLPQKERVKALSEGRLASSPELKELVVELDSRDSKGRVDYFFSALKNPPEKMRKPEESVRLGIWPKFQSLLSHERAYLLDLTWEKKQSFAGRHPSLRETAPRLEEAPGRSLRIYTAAVTEIERRLIDEAIRQKQPAGRGGQEIESVDGLLDREEKLRIRTIAAGLAWERIEPREILTNDPAVIELLSLNETVARLRDDAQPRAREAAGKLDEFIRSRDLDQFAAEKTDYYYRADQIPMDELEKLSPADKLEFAALGRQAGATFSEFKEGFGAIDKIRIEIDRARNGAGRAVAAGGAQAREDRGQHIDRAVDQGNRVGAPVLGPEREQMNDRIILGNAIIAHARADSAALDYEVARDHGRTFRFNVRDESVDANRRISDLDVHRRASARGDRAADERGAERKEDRVAIRGQVSEVDVRHHSTTLVEHGKKLEKLVHELESKAKDALTAYRHAREIAGVVIEKYQKRGEAPPAPFVERETLVKTQEETIERRLAGHTERLERLRIALAEEHGQPLRDDREAARLAAQLFTAHTELQSREERAARFDETRHLRQWEIRGEKLSLADLDRLIEQATDKSQLVGKREFHIFPGGRRQASAEVERLGGIRQEVVEIIGEQRDDLRKSVREAGKLLDALTRAYKREASLREQAGLAMPAPQFTRQELERSADNIETARDAAALRQLSVFERQFNAYADPNERFNPAEGWGRAPARALVAEIFHRESSERLTAFRERGGLQPLLIETSSGLVTNRFKNTEPRSIIELLARPVVETPAQREIRHGAQAAFAQCESRLQADVEKTRAYMEAAREIASSQAAERSLRAGRELPAPDAALTPKQAMIVEIHAERQTAPEERERLLSLARGGALSQYDSHSRTNSHDRAAAREVASVIGRAR